MEFIGEKYAACVVRLDGNAYRSCTFEDVVFQYDGGTVALEGNRIVNCRWEFSGAAGRTLALLQGLNRQAGGGDLISDAFPLTIV